MKTVIIEKELLEAIQNGKIQLGSKIPSRASLMHKYHCSRTTIERAVAHLTSEGLLAGQRGSGTRVLSSTTTRTIKSLLFIPPVFTSRPTPASLLFPEEVSGLPVRLLQPSRVLNDIEILTQPDCGVIWCMPGEEMIYIMDLLSKRGIPQLLINRDYKSIDYVQTDAMASIKEGLSWLMIEAGREIALVSHAPSTERPYLAERILSFYRSSVDLGAILKPANIQIKDFFDVPGEIAETAKSLFVDRQPPQGIFVLDYELALPLIMSARGYGLTAGKDFPMLVFDYVPELEHQPGIAMMRQPYRRFHEEIARWLLTASRPHSRFCVNLKTEFHYEA